MPKGTLQILAPLLCGVVLLLGVVGLNALLRGHFRDGQRCTLAFGDIECAPPGQLSREEFLGEVQYLAHWPDEINLLDDGLPAHLHLSFAAHPWVEAVESVRIEPPHRVVVLLRYRTPALAVVQPDDKTAAWIPARDGRTKLPGRVVDRRGVLLPLAAGDPQLPVLYGTVPAPTGHTGQPWGDEGVAQAAAVAVLLAPYQQQLKLNWFERRDGLLILSNSNSRTLVRWGPPATEQTPDESRLQALLDVQLKKGNLDGWIIDVRAPEQPVLLPCPTP